VRHGDHRGGAPRGALPAGVALPSHERELEVNWSVWGSRSPAAPDVLVLACLFQPFGSHLLPKRPLLLGRTTVLEPPAETTQ